MKDTILQETTKLRSVVRRLKPGEDIKYLLLIKVPDSDEQYWEIITGREEAYKYIKNNIAEIDLDYSFIIANGMKNINLENMHKIYDFVKFVKEENDISDEFDVDDYLTGVDTSYNIGEGLATGGNVFTGVSGSFESINDDDE